MPRFFLIMGHKTPEDAHAHVEENHGEIVGSRLLPSPAGEMVYGVIEFVITVAYSKHAKRKKRNESGISVNQGDRTSES